MVWLNFFRFITIGIVPKSLGPESYGDLSFLTSFYQRLLKFLNSGSREAFYTQTFKPTKRKKLITFYFIFLLALFGIISFFLLAFTLTSTKDIIFPMQKVVYVWLAFLLVILQFLISVLRNINDAYGFTVKMEKIIIFQTVLSVVFILVLANSNKLELFSYFTSQSLAAFFAIIISIGLLIKEKVISLKYIRIAKNNFIIYSKEFYRYSHPLFFAGLIGFIIAFGDRWLLQFISGSKEQGYYGLALKLNAISLIVVSAFPNLLTREFSIHFAQDNLKSMRSIFEKYFYLFYFIVSFFSIFIIGYSKLLCFIIGGEIYVQAALVISILMLDSINSTISQFNGAVLLASEKTKILRNIAIPMRLLGVPISLFLILPTKYGGLELGAIGLAIKIFVIRFISSNIELIITLRYLSIPIKKVYLRLVFILTPLIIILAITKFLVVFNFDNRLITFFVNGFIYSIFTGVLIFFSPSLINMEREKLLLFLKSFLK